MQPKTAALLVIGSTALLSCRAAPMAPAPDERLLTGTSTGQGSLDDGAGYGYDAFAPDPFRPIRDWRAGEVLVQGYLGFHSVQTLTRTGGGLGDIDGGDGSISQYPAVGGGFQWNLTDAAVDVGIEGLISIGGRADGIAFVAGGNGAAIAVSLDLVVVDVYGGPFISIPLGDRARWYGGLGPLIQFADYDQSSYGTVDPGSGSGFGIGGYARTGVELGVSPSTYIGLGVRYSGSTIDLSNGLGELDLETVEGFASITIRG